jgi:hypothetical protein
MLPGGMETAKLLQFSSGLHLDDIQQEGQDSLLNSTIIQSFKETSSNESKRREQVKLVKEYIECCRSPDAHFEFFLGKNEREGAPCDIRELSSFLRPPCSSLSAHPLHVFSRTTPGNGPASRRGDIPFSAAAKSALPNISSFAAAAANVGAISDTAVAPCPAHSMVDTKEGSVYRAQVATALNAGRAVWL